MKRHLFGLPACAAAMAVAIAGCGGGGGDDETLAGRFGGPAVENLRYETDSQSGRTDATGGFRYRAGERVRFFVGDIALGSAPAAAMIDPFTLAGMDAAPTASMDLVREGQRLRRAWRSQGTRFEVATNLAVFLQSIDADGDPANGVAVPEALHVLAAGRTLRFDTLTLEFASQPPLRRLMADARAAGLWGGTRALRRPSQALRATYAALGLAPQLFASVGRQTDRGADGRIDTQERLEINADGDVVRGEWDRDGDGIFDRRWRYGYDSSGRPTEFDSSTVEAGTSSTRRERSFYDGNGFLVRSEYDTDGDGVVDRVWQLEREADGSLRRSSMDLDGDGSAEVVHEYERSGDGSEERSRELRGGRIVSAFVTNRDAEGRELRQALDRDADGRFDIVITHTYDDSGRLLRVESDDDADGHADRVERRTYDAAGQLVREEQDSDGDGTADGGHRYAYDDQGRRTLTEEDRDGDGRPDWRVSDHYDTLDNVVRREYDANADGSTDYVDVRHVDSHGYVVRKTAAYEPSGTPDVVTTHEWAPVSGFSAAFWGGN